MRAYPAGPTGESGPERCGGGGPDDVRAEAGAGGIGDGFEAVGLVVGRIEQQLVVGVLGGRELVGAQGQLSYAGTLQVQGASALTTIGHNSCPANP
ncbi:hypothetical protein [Streptomyces sp. NPDC059009]|uniref:hypothetical protein n=1 Tax=Streptomyces sp. NPDC059009 TaxID=3346694 RepID=UPI0036BCA3A3